MAHKVLILTKFSNKIHFFIPTSFDKFFETGKFEEKTNSVQCHDQQFVDETHAFFVKDSYADRLIICLLPKDNLNRKGMASLNERPLFFLFFF